MSTYIKSICLAFSFLLTIGVANATITPKKADFVFIVDASGSVLNEITAIKNGLSQFANGLDQAQVDAQFAIVLIGQEPEIVLQMTSSTADVESAFNSISVYGAVSGFQNSHYLNPEAGLEAIRMVLGAANNSVISHEYVGGNGSISFRPDSRKNLILVTDENSDMPFYEENRVAGQTYTEPPYYNFTDSAWQQEINNTAQIVIDNNAYVNLLVNPYDFSTKNQYGSPASDVADVNLLNYDPAATRAKLIQDGYGESLQAQVLGAGLIARSFDINKVSTSSFVDNFFAAKVEEVSKQELIPSILASHNPTLVDYTVTLDGSNSAHQDTARQVVLWEWDLDDDGVFEATGPITQTSFAEEGDYTVKLRVTDDGEQPETAEAYVVIKALLPHQKPIANAGGPYNFCLNEEQWNLDGGKSFNPDDGLHEEGSPEDKIIAYVWELDGNNDYLDADGINPEVKIQLGELELGNYPVKLRVTDNTAESFPSSGLSNQSDTAISTFSIRDESDLLCSCLPELTLEYSYSVFGPKVDLAWNDQNAEGFNVYRSATATGQYELLTAVPVITTSFIDEEVEYEQTYYYQVSKLDIDNNAICKSIKVSINIPSYYNTNYAPIISSEPVLAANEDALYQYDVNATDYNYGDVITYSLEMAPSGMNIDANTGMIEWTPVNAQVGEHTVRVIASDQHGAKDTQIFTVQVGDFNQPPEITSTPLLMITETDNYQYSVLAFDPDMEDDLTYSLVQFPAGMVINSTTGDISWQTETGTVGVFAVEVLVSDSHGATDNQVFDIIVIPLNRPPVIISTAPETGKEEELYQYQVVVEDPDVDDVHTFSIEAKPIGMQIDAATGLITWTPELGQAGVHSVIVVVTDEGGLTDSQTFGIDVEQKNLAPEITSTPSTTTFEAHQYKYQLTAEDPNAGDVLTFNKDKGPMSIDAEGLSTWVPVSSDAGTDGKSPELCQIDLPDIGTFKPVIKWHWSTEQVLSVPLVIPFIDTNGDGLVNENDDSVVIANSFSGSVDRSTSTMRVINASTGETIWTLEDPELRSEGSSHFAGGDIDGDGIPEVVMYLRNGGVAVINNDGSLKWRSDLPSRSGVSHNYSAINIADLDGDGQAEILARDHVLNSDGSVRWSAPEAASHISKVTKAIASDIDLDGVQEVIIIDSVYKENGELLWDAGIDGLSSGIGNFDDDDNPEVVVIQSGKVTLLDHDGSVLWNTSISGDTLGGSPTIGDMDGDGYPEIGVAMRNYYTVLNHDGSILWQNTIRDYSSAVTGSTVFDFDGDGRVEIVYADEYYLHVYDGKTGQEIFNMSNRSPTATEYPVIADIDNDGHAEILLPSDSGLRALEDINDNWVATRSIWNQYDYSVDNINDDGTIPAIPARGWLTHNSYRLNTFPERNARDLPDLTLKDILWNEEANTLSVTAINGGNAPANNTTLSVYSADPALGGELLATEQISIAGQQQSTFAFELAQGITSYEKIYAVLDAEKTSNECDENNNTHFAHVSSFKVTDVQGLFDTQTYTLNVLPLNYAPVITSQAPSIVFYEELYEYSVIVVEPDSEDVLSYILETAPEGMRINSSTGHIGWKPSVEDVGNHTVKVKVVDNSGAFDTQEFILTVQDANKAPYFISQPVTTAIEGVQQSYQVEAADPNIGDTFTFNEEEGPVNVEADGSAAWIPSADLAGTDAKSPEVCMTDIPEIGTLEPVKKWSWTGSDILPNYHYAAAPSMVAQTNDDNGDGVIDGSDNPDVIFAAYYFGHSTKGYLRIISGIDGSLLATNEDLELNGYASLAVADIDGDGLIEILAAKYGGGVVAFENDGTFKWEKINSNDFTCGGMSVADLDGNGTVEILGAEDILDSSGNVLFELTESGGGPIGPITFAADINLDGKQEIIKWPYVYSSQGEQLWKANAVNGFAAVGNFDEDDYAEIVGISDGKVYLYNHDGTIIFSDIAIPGGGKGGAPTVADVDGDGEPEIGVAGADYYAVYNMDGSLLWQKKIHDHTSNVTGSSVFDFNGDGKVEVVYADEYYLRIYDGGTGRVIYEVENRSHTAYENPVIVDIDNDNHAEIVVTASHNEGGYEYGIRVFEDANDSWMPTRKIWNQHAYSIDNINDDGTVPANPDKGWLTHNSFRLNAFTERDARDIADLSLKDILWDEQTNTINVTVVNGGKAPSIATDVVLYNGDPEAEGTVIGTIDVLPLHASGQQTYELEVPAGIEGLEQVYAVVDSQNTTEECLETNNKHLAHVSKFIVTDQKGASGSQTFLLNVIPDNSAPQITSQPVSEFYFSKNNNVEAVWIDTHGNKESNEVYGAYSLKEGYKYKVSVRGTYTVWTNPGGTEQGIPESTPIYPSAGAANDKVYFDSQFAFGYPYSHESFTEFPTRVSQFKFSLNNGDDWNHAISPTDYNLQHKYDYVVTGESYPFGIKLFDHPYNDNSGMLKVDINTAEDGVVYVYKVQAADVDGDELTYSLVSAPKGMSIDPESGEIEWLPDVNSLGKFKVVVKVADSHGMYAIQSYTVETFMGNKRPEITTQPLTVGAVGIPYVYDVDATDEDGDAVSFSLTASSLPGLVIDAETGVLSYTPTAEDLGVHSVTITADDSFGGKAYQSYNLMISQEVNNPPGISSTPDTIAVAGQEYTYQVEADDPDGDALNYSVDAGDITEVSIESETGLLSWTPTLDNVGTHMVEVTVDDGRGGYVIQKYSLAVIDGAANNPPEITTTPTFYAYVDTQYTYDIDATDIDNDSLEYLLIEGPEGMVVDSVSGMITYTASIDQKGEYTVQVQANDGRSGSSTQTYSLFVIEEGENHPPVINSAAPINGEIDQLYSYDANAIDEDSDPLVYSLLVSPAGMTIDQNSGLVEWTPTAEQLGEHAIKVQAEDGRGGLSTQQYTLTITEDINYDPEIASSPNTQTLINQSYIYDVNAADTDGDTLSYSVSPKPDGMRINSSSGLIEWTPSNEQAGSYILTVFVEDGVGGEAQQIFTLTVSASDLPYLANEPTDTATVDEYYRYRIYALDADGYSVNIELINGPDGMVLQDVNGYPILQWFPEQDNCEEYVTLRLTDRLSRVAEVTYGIRVYSQPKKLNRIQCSQEDASCNN